MHGINTNRILNIKSFLILILVFFISFLYLRIYSITELEGKTYKYMLPAEMFGIPKILKEKGFESLYKENWNTGWDGQFYYYISNDIFGLTDIPQHMDANAYRYQRIGLPILANILSKLTFQDYVSPLVYYSTSLLLILLATFLFSTFLINRNYSPFLSLFWSLGIGVQLTLLNGLPDAAADSLFIIAVLSWINRRYFSFIFFATFAALTREAYIILPFVLFVYYTFYMIKYKKFDIKLFFSKNIYFLIPGFIFFIWQIYIRIHFNISPSSQAFNILDFPFFSFMKHIYLSFLGVHPVNKDLSSSEVVFLIYFLLLLLITLRYLLVTYRKISDDIKPISISIMGIILLYFCFGDTVMMHFTGYMKASTIFFFALIFFIALNNQKIKMPLLLFFIIGLVIFNHGLIQRMHLGDIVIHEKLLNNKDEVVLTKTECLDDYRFSSTIIGIDNLIEDNLINNSILKLLGKNNIKIVKISLTNKSLKTWELAKGFGAINISYHWIDENGKVIQDGLRTKLQKKVLPNETITVDVLFQESQINNAKFVISPVQEGCAWFYLNQ